MLCNIVISLKLSDEGLTNKPKAHKQPRREKLLPVPV